MSPFARRVFRQMAALHAAPAAAAIAGAQCHVLTELLPLMKSTAERIKGTPPRAHKKTFYKHLSPKEAFTWLEWEAGEKQFGLLVVKRETKEAEVYSGTEDWFVPIGIISTVTDDTYTHAGEYPSQIAPEMVRLGLLGSVHLWFATLSRAKGYTTETHRTDVGAVNTALAELGVPPEARCVPPTWKSHRLLS